jgi:homeobox protein goosecoid
MVETSSPGLLSRGTPYSQMSPSSAQNYLSTAMLLGSQGCGYFGQRMSTNNDHFSAHNSHLNRSLNTSSSSLFTIESILAPKNGSNRKSESPSPSPSESTTSSPIRPQRVPAMLHHSGLHLGHLAAAAASGFGATSDFLGKRLMTKTKER